ncbi:hypothetical protein PSFL111601_26970 [Pseudomonas floridensis]
MGVAPACVDPDQTVLLNDCKVPLLVSVARRLPSGLVRIDAGNVNDLTLCIVSPAMIRTFQAIVRDKRGSGSGALLKIGTKTGGEYHEIGGDTRRRRVQPNATRRVLLNRQQ